MHNLNVNPQVSQDIQQGQPVVALESTIISHGMPYPQNVETALQVEQQVRDHGATPATIAIMDGQLQVGLTQVQIEALGKAGATVRKTSRRDIPFVVAQGQTGATTVAATMIIAALAKIPVFATGGIGGVHRGGEASMDISADLQELARTNVAVVCAGIKSVLDIGRTLEYLETQGVPVVGYQTDQLPAFYSRDSGHRVDYRVDDPRQLAQVMLTKWQLGLAGGMVVANPVPKAHAMPNNQIDQVIDAAIADMNRQQITGKDTTPFLLAKVAEQTGGKSLATNIQLVLNNAALAAQIASAYAQLRNPQVS